MLFNTAQFFVFLAIVLTLFYAAPRATRKYILLVASYYFYASWNAKFIVLLLTLTVIDYISGLWLERVPPGPRRRAVLIFSLAANLGFLGFFKYYNFLGHNLALALGRPGNAFFLDIVLPLGISFHTFQSMSYVVDVYRGRIPPETSLLRYAAYIMFFPHLETDNNGILNAMANEQSIPVKVTFPAPVKEVTLVLWGSTNSPALLEARDKDGKLLDSASVEKVPERKSPADPIPSFHLTVKGTDIAFVLYGGAPNGGFIAAEEVRYTPTSAATSPAAK